MTGVHYFLGSIMRFEVWEFFPLPSNKQAFEILFLVGVILRTASARPKFIKNWCKWFPTEFALLFSPYMFFVMGWMLRFGQTWPPSELFIHSRITPEILSIYGIWWRDGASWAVLAEAQHTKLTINPHLSRTSCKFKKHPHQGWIAGYSNLLDHQGKYAEHPTNLVFFRPMEKYLKW